jgi:hypothetical protein
LLNKQSNANLTLGGYKLIIAVQTQLLLLLLLVLLLPQH